MVKFKNNKGINIQVRFEDSPNHFRWNTLRPGQEVDLSQDYGVNLGLTEVKEDIVEPVREVKKPKSKKK